MTPSAPVVSIIVRSMDRPTLGEALTSIARQDYPYINTIVVNAAGGQHSPCDHMVQPRSLQIINQDGQPLSRAKAANAGLDAARSTYLAFLDDDDTLDPNHVSHLVQVLESAPRPSVAYAGVRCMARDDPAHQITRIFGQVLDSPAHLLAGNFIPIHGPIFPKSLIEHARCDESLETYEDWDFWLQLVQRAPFIYTHQITATYYTGGSSGVSPQAPDWDAVRRASRALFSKWMRLTPDDFRNICNLYHSAVAQRDASQKELDELKTKSEQIRHQHSALTQQLNHVYRSTSWQVTRPLRQFKTWANQFFNR
jgi:glycosyltransferase involved in cell wall biosynthesis